MLTFQRQFSMNLKQLRYFTSSNALSSKDDSFEKNDKQSSNKDEEKSRKEVNKEEVNAKLNDLLQMMVKKDEDSSIKVKVPQAVKRQKEKFVKEKPLGEKLADAAKDVATSLGGDVQKTESELLNILLKRTEPSTQILTDVLSGMKVDKEHTDKDSRAKQVRVALGGQPISTQLKMERFKMRKPGESMKKDQTPVDILGAKPSSYFTGLNPAPAPCNLSTWDSCVQRDLRLASTHPPSNIYEQMIQWTDRGILWKFPIDNEQGLEDEKQVSFEEHVFLENHLEGWCPEKGPIRHFMELVCVGLSKNHWLTVEEKKNHLYWFRDYFVDKQQLLKEIGAGTVSLEGNDQEQTSQ